MATSWLTEARKLDAHGFNVLPADQTKKVPALWLVDEGVGQGADRKFPWKRWQTERSTAQLLKWFRKDRPKGIALCVVTGRISRIAVLDVDSPKAYALWAERIGADVLEATTHVRTQSYEKKGGNGVGHYYFRLPEGMVVRGHGQPEHHEQAGILWDLKAEGGHVMVPPSDGYEWIRPVSALQDLPDNFVSTVNELIREGGAGTSSGRSMLSELLARMPTMGEGTGRNQVLTQVAGHYAKSFRFRDAFEAQVRMANATFLDPLDENEVDKMIDSIWGAEEAKGLPEDRATADNGFLAHGGRCLLVQVRFKNEEGSAEINFADWSDFNIEALGVVEDEGANRIYDVRVHRKRQGDERRGQLPAHILADARKLAVWLAEFGVGVSQPDAAWPRMAWQERLRRYIENQEPPHFQVVHSLGYHKGSGFITHEGVITAAGLQEFGAYRPHPTLLQWATYRYGFNPDAIEVLREVLTFHHPQVAAVFGSWWAACFLKPQIVQTASLFPFMALEAPSEAGKTTGYFSLMLSLAGNTKGQVAPTRAALRDYIGAHHSGAVWVDDMDRLDHITELLRAATGDGTMVKKGEDNTTQVEAHLVAPVVVSGEALGLRDQKALIDRAVQLEVPSPTKRRSTTNPDRLQWDDVVSLRNRHPDLTVFAGTLVQEFLRRKAEVDRLSSFRPDNGGRWADKIAIIRLGAWLLADVTGLDWIVPTVDRWVSEQVDYGDENALTLKLIPIALQQTGFVNQPNEGHDRWPMTPTVVRSGVVWFSPRLLAQWWEAYKNGRVEQRTESAEALSQQAKILGLGGQGTRTQLRAQGSGESSRAKYWSCPPALSDKLLERAVSGGYEDGSDEVAPSLPGTGDSSLPERVTRASEPEIAHGAVWSTSDPSEQAEWLEGR